MTLHFSAKILLAPATTLVVVGVVVPFAFMLRISFNDFQPGLFMVEAFTLTNYAKLLTEPYWAAVTASTLTTSIASTVLALMLAFPIGVALARTRSRHKSLFVLLTVTPLFVGSAVRAAGWMGLLGYGGIADSAATGMGLIHQGSLNLMFSPTAVVIGTVSVVIPYIALSVQAGLESVPADLEPAARSLGASPAKAFLKAVLPLAAPSIIGGTALVFILCINSFATPVLLGGPRFKMLGPAIYDQITGRSNWPFGSALSFMLVAVTLTTLAALYLARRVLFRRLG